MREVKPEWAKKRWGLQLGHTEHTILTSLSFADDVLLVATSLSQLTKMLSQFSEAASKRGLELHQDKTKFLSNATKRTGRGRERYMRCGEMSIEMLPHSESLKYLGRKVSFDSTQEIEIENRISNAWKKFMAFKNEMTSKQYPLKHRLRLFNGTVTPTILYGSATWTLTCKTESRIRSTQRKMLRMILGSGRRRTPQGQQERRQQQQQQDEQQQQQQAQTQPQTQAQPQPPPQPQAQPDPQQEQRQLQQQHQRHHQQQGQHGRQGQRQPRKQRRRQQRQQEQQEQQQQQQKQQNEIETWVEWIKRTTREAEKHLQELNVDDWVTAHRKRKYAWATKVATLPSDRWAKKAVQWQPHLQCPKLSRNAARKVGHPRARWEDDLRSFCSHYLGRADWLSVAQDQDTWEAHSDKFLKGDWRHGAAHQSCKPGQDSPLNGGSSWTFHMVSVSFN